MAAETLSSERAREGFPEGGAGDALNVRVAWGAYPVAANVEDGDIFEMHYIPDGCTIIGGWLIAPQIDSDLEETLLDMDIGWAANDTDAADPDGLGNLGVWEGIQSVHIPANGNYFPYQNVLMTAGPKTFTRNGGQTMIQIEANAAAGTFAAGTMTAATLLTTP